MGVSPELLYSPTLFIYTQTINASSSLTQHSDLYSPPAEFATGYLEARVMEAASSPA